MCQGKRVSGQISIFPAFENICTNWMKMNNSHAYFEVAIALPVSGTFIYDVPQELISSAFPGKSALVPFGARNVTGYILGPGTVNHSGEIKTIRDVLDEKPLFHESMIPFFRWIADYYMYPIGEVIKNSLPKGLNLNEVVLIEITEGGRKAFMENKAVGREGEILSLLDRSSMDRKKLFEKLGGNISTAIMQSMTEQGFIKTRRELNRRTARPRLEKYVALIKSDIPEGRYFVQRKKVIDTLAAEGEIPVKTLKKKIPEAAGFINYLTKAGYVSMTQKRVYRDPLGEPVRPDTGPELSENQQQVISEVIGSLGKGFSAYLLAGVTGSGKTEVYIQVAAGAMALGYSVLVLVPEIALISQTARRFRARFGEHIAILHSGLSTGERYDQWTRIADRKASIVVGTRSSIFAPLVNTGVIIVDEEHDTSYKQDNGLRYNARDLAVVRAKLETATVLLGSATPSLQSHYNVKVGKFAEIELPHRITKQPLPDIRVIDLRKFRDIRGLGRYFTPPLIEAMKETLEQGEQVLLFLNRRGFASFPVCADCGESLKCRNCDITLTLHKASNAYRCHFCDFSCSSLTRCNTCGSSRILLMGLGTEKVEAAAKSVFPDARVARLDRDTTTRKGAIVKILRDLRENKTDILIGTQMVAKGHDFPNITLVGIICADLSLGFPDFRAGEQTFQLLAQVAGRAGRGKKPGRVILQTYAPGNFSIVAAQHQDHHAFYKKEIEYRKALNYPPYTRLIQIKISGKDKQGTGRHAKIIGELLNAVRHSSKSFYHTIEILGPLEAYVLKIAGRYRWQILLKGKESQSLHLFMNRAIHDNTAAFNNRKVNVVVDVDPYFIM